jgi:hypothetical protein
MGPGFAVVAVAGVPFVKLHSYVRGDWIPQLTMVAVGLLLKLLFDKEGYN